MAKYARRVPRKNPGRRHKEIQSALKGLEADIQVKEEKVQKEQSLLQKQVIDLKGEKEILQQQLKAKDNLLQELRRLREKEVTPLQQQVTDLQEQLKAKDSLLQENCQQLQQKEGEGSSLQQQVADLQEQLDGLL